MDSDSKLIKWFGSVIKYVDSFSIEPDAEFLQGSEYCKSTKEDESRIDEPLQCSTPIPRTSYLSHPGMMDRNKRGDKNSTLPKRTFSMMQENEECGSTPIYRSAIFSNPGMMDHNQMGDKNSTLPKRTLSMMQENVECGSTPISRSAGFSHPGMMDHNKMGDKNHTLPKTTFNMQEYTESCSTPISQTDYFSNPGMKSHNQIDIETFIMQENVECCKTLIAPSAYFSQDKIMDHNQMGVGKPDSPKETLTTKENASCFKEKNFFSDCGESSRNAEGEASDSNKRLPPPVSEKPSELRANTQMESLCSNISEQRPKSARKKDIDPCFEAVVRKMAEQVAEEMALSEDAVHSTGAMLMKVFDTIASRAARITAFRKRKTLTLADLRLAIEMTLPPKMASTSDRNASLKVQGKDG